MIRLSQDTFERMFDSVPALIFVTDRYGSLQWVNRAFIDFFGISRESVEGKKYSDFFSSAKAEILIDLEELVSSGESEKGVLRLVHVRPPEEKIVKMDLIPWKGTNGTINGIIGFGIDITEQYRMEQIKRDVYTQIEKNIEQFAILGDHLRNPLAVIIGLCDLLGDEKIAKQIIGQAREINTIISRIDTGWIESEKIREFIKKYYDIGVQGTHELVARAIHESYIQQQMNAGVTPDMNPAMRPWSKLPPHLKDPNMRQAEDIGRKLQTIHCGIGFATNNDDLAFSFTKDEVDQLAKREHGRWMNEKLKKGWVYGTPRSDQDRIHDCLVPWDDLPLSQKEKDRNAILVLPIILSKVHLKIFRFSDKKI